MYNVEPQGIIYLCKTPLENDYKNQLTFTNSTVQENYFNSTVVKSYSEYTYQRHDSAVKVGANIDDIINCNYMFYRNVGFSDKIYYCFITDMQYVNENCTLITFETDVFQTYQFDIEYKECFTEREHVNDDSIGINTVPENVELGEYVVNEHIKDNYNNDTTIITGATVGPSDLETFTIGKYNGITSGCEYCRWDNNNFNDLKSFLSSLDSHGKKDALLSMFIAPKWLAPVNGTVYVTQTNEPAHFDIGISKINNLNGYIPKNNKLFTYPYCYINVSNNSGQSIVLNQELWGTTNNLMSLRVYGCLSPGCSMRALPLNYKNDSVRWEEGISCGKYPQLNWSSSQYTNWLAQNGINIGLSTAGALVSTGVGIATHNPVGIASGLLAIGQSIGQVTQHSLIPNSVSGNLNSGDVTVASGENRIHMYKMTIKEEYAKIIDDYFTMFGYKVNKLKVPNITGRENWNYVKTIECNFDGDIPQAHLNIIKAMFNSGVTLWHNPNAMYNYNLSNNII